MKKYKGMSWRFIFKYNFIICFGKSVRCYYVNKFHHNSFIYNPTKFSIGLKSEEAGNKSVNLVSEISLISFQD